MSQEQLDAFNPRFHAAVELIGKRWSGVIIRTMFGGAKHFSEFTANIPGLSDRLLSVRLKELETAGLVQRVVIPDTPVRIEYGLTEKGKALRPVIKEIDRWARTWL